MIDDVNLINTDPFEDIPFPRRDASHTAGLSLAEPRRQNSDPTTAKTADQRSGADWKSIDSLADLGAHQPSWLEMSSAPTSAPSPQVTRGAAVKPAAKNSLMDRFAARN